MTEYKDIPTQELLDLAKNSSSELSAIGSRLFNNEVGNGTFVWDDETAIFLASARSIVLELITRLNHAENSVAHYQQSLQESIEDIRVIGKLLEAKDYADDTSEDVVLPDVSEIGKRRFTRRIGKAE